MALALALDLAFGPLLGTKGVAEVGDAFGTARIKVSVPSESTFTRHLDPQRSQMRSLKPPPT